jgi:hypothetical protein
MAKTFRNLTNAEATFMEDLTERFGSGSAALVVVAVESVVELFSPADAAGSSVIANLLDRDRDLDRGRRALASEEDEVATM